MITARLNDYRQSPRKVRLVANLVKGKKVEDAKNTLNFLIRRAAKPLADLIDSAVANASHNFNISADKLFVKEFRVDEGVVLKRRMPRARGMAYPINKRTSHIFIQLDTIDNMPVKKGKKSAVKVVTEKKVVKKVAKKVAETK
ncbi:MAG: 50S ribosomal protein L22 [Candidatus Paceibacterota bacterium]|jgi:large subunit ribosomal protein L22